MRTEKLDLSKDGKYENIFRSLIEQLRSRGFLIKSYSVTKIWETNIDITFELILRFNNSFVFEKQICLYRSTDLTEEDQTQIIYTSVLDTIILEALWYFQVIKHIDSKIQS